MSGIPERYKNANFEEDLPKAIQVKFQAIVTGESKRGLYMSGPVGIGKTHMAYAMAKYAVEKKVPVGVVNTTELLRDIKLDMDRKKSEKVFREEALLKFRGVLIMDDIGSEKVSDWVAETFYLIINKRYTEMLPTIFTSNLPIGELAEKIGDRTASRIVEMCEIVKLQGKDRRVP